jgi:hypothetical protein
MGEHLGIVDGGEGWPVVVITENGTTVEQGTGGGEKLKYGRLEVTQRMRWVRGARGHVREPTWQLGGGQGATERAADGELNSAAKVEGRSNGLN